MSSMNSRDSLSDSTFPELAPLAESGPREIPTPPHARQRSVLKRIARGLPTVVSDEEFAHLESHHLIKRMPVEIERSFHHLPGAVSELLTLGGNGPDVAELVRPLINAFRLQIDVRLPKPALRLGLVGLARQPLNSANRSLHGLIRTAKADYESNKSRFLDLWLDVKNGRESLLRYRNNYFSYVDIGCGRARITEDGLRRIRLLDLDQQVFGD